MEQTIYSQSTLPHAVSTAYVVQVIPSSEIEREALAMESLLQAFTLDDPFSLELCGDPDQQRFLLRTTSLEALETLCQQLLAQYPQAQLRRVSPIADPLTLSEGEHAIVGDFALRAPAWMPIKTFWNEEMTQEGTDPIVGMLSAMEPVTAGERIICQVALVSAPDSWALRYQRKALEHPLDKERQAEAASSVPAQDTAWDEARGLLAPLAVVLVCVQGYLWYRAHAWGTLVVLALALVAGLALFLWWKLHHQDTLYDMKLVSEKLMRTSFYAQVRVVIIGDQRKSERRLRKHLSRIEVAYRQYDLAGSNGFELKRVQHVLSDDEHARYLCRPENCLSYHTRFARMLHRGWSATVLNTREVSGMWHLLQGQAEVPLVERMAMKKILASPEVFQRVRSEPGAFPPVLAGHSVHRGYSVPIFLPESVLFSHKFLVAKSGYGKSTLMQLLLRGAMEPIQSPSRLQPGVVAIDPHGDLIDDLLHQIPESRIHDVMLIDLSDEEHPVGINLLDATMGFTCDQAVANAMASFARIWRDSWGPRLAYILRNVLKSLYTANEQLVEKGHKERQYTLLDVNSMLQQPKYARKILAELDKENMHHQRVLSFWNDYYFKLPPNMQQEAISPVSNKIGIFSDNRVLERIVGQPVTTINFATAVQCGQIVLVNLASGRLEFDASAIIGATILNLVHRILQQQATVPLPLRRQIFIAVDEFQNIPGADYEALLSEDRKYGGSLMLATQSLIRLEQMKEGLEMMTFSNCAQLFAFATSAEDAEKLEKELHGQVTVPYILNQPRLTCYARLALPDQPVQIFSMQLAKPEGWERSQANDEKAASIRASNRKLHPTAAQVDERLLAHSKRLLEMSAPPAPTNQNQPKAPNQPGKGQQPQQQQAKSANGQPQQAKPGNGHPQPQSQQQAKPGNKGQSPQQQQSRSGNGQPQHQQARSDKGQEQPQQAKPEKGPSQPANQNQSRAQNQPGNGQQSQKPQTKPGREQMPHQQDRPEKGQQAQPQQSEAKAERSQTQQIPQQQPGSEKGGSRRESEDAWTCAQEKPVCEADSKPVAPPPDPPLSTEEPVSLAPGIV